MSIKIEKMTGFKWLNLFTISKEGKPDWIFASRTSNLTIDNFNASVDKTDAIIIVPIHNNKIVLIEQFREPIQNIEIGFPAGLYEENDTIETAIARELKEETGLDLIKINRISPQLFSSSGMTDESVKIVWVECDGDVSLEYQEQHEDILNIFEISINEIENFISGAPYLNMIDNRPKVFGAKSYLILLQLMCEHKK